MNVLESRTPREVKKGSERTAQRGKGDTWRGKISHEILSEKRRVRRGEENISS